MWTTVAILGVLKAGGAFLLLDPSIPEKRLQFMVQHTEACLILSSLSAQSLSSRLVKEVITIDPGFFASLGEYPNEHLPCQSPSSLLYVIFTSGSTGVPKCVMITHTNIASALRHQVDLLGFTKDSRVLDFSSYSFTTTISNVFGALAAGGCLCVPNDEDRQTKLPEVIRSLQANIIDLTPSVMQFLVPEEVPTLQVLIFGGEALYMKDIKPWWGKVRTIYLYGQSECTSNGTINDNPSSLEDVLHIGKGAGLVTWIVDPSDHNNLLPLGCISELLLEGPLVGFGYLNEPEKTAATFIENPTWLLQGAPCRLGQHGQHGRHGRLCKTDDLVQYNEDGSLTFLGRKDAQVKIRGQRVELGEIEHWVKKCTDVKQVVAEVVLPQGEDSSPTLVAFLQIHNETAASDELGPTAFQVPADVEDKLAEHLPTYMMPTAFFSMRELPMTATGKMDRKQLREIGASFSVEQLAEMRTATGPKRQPTSEIEQSIQRIWAQILNIRATKIGLDDSFFHLGGDSVAAIKAVSQARKVGTKLAVADIFRHPVLHDLVNQGGHILNETQEEVTPFALLSDGLDITSFFHDISNQYHLDRANIQDAYPCTPLQEGLISLTSKRPGDYITQSVLELAPNLAVKDLCMAWEQIAYAMPILRTKFVQHSDLGLLQVVLEEQIRWIDAIGLDKYIEADRKQPMDLGQPLTRYALVKDDAGTPRWFVWTVHHVLYDGWSLGLVMDAVHRAFRGESIQRGPQFQSFIKYIKDRDDETLINYWTQAINNRQFVPFPTLPPSVNQPLADEVVKYELLQPKRLSKSITTSTLIRAAWALITGRMTDSENAVFGVTVSGRNAPVAGIEAMVAPTFATVPHCVQLPGDQKVSDYLETVQQQAIDMIPFEQAGLHRIAKMSPDCRNACMFQSLLVVQPQESSSAGQEALGNWLATAQQQWLNTYALMLDVRLGAEGLQISASFDGRVLGSQMVYILLKRLEFAMQQLDNASNTESILAEIEVMTPQDLEQIWEWNCSLPTPVEQCVHNAIQERAIAQPNAPAICAWDGELTYMELDQLAGRLVNQLANIGVKPDLHTTGTSKNKKYKIYSCERISS